MASFDSGDELAYLMPGFDLNSLTVPRLRSILVNHDVPYPTSAKKAQLISIVESDVLPKAKQLLRQRDRIHEQSTPKHFYATTPTMDERRKRKTEPPLLTRLKQEGGIMVPTSATFEAPVSGLRPFKAEEWEEEDIEPREEFTPDEQLALMQAQATPRKAVVKRRPASQGKSAQLASWFVIFTLLSSIGLWWRKEKVEIGYCGVGKKHWSLEGTKVPKWANALEPKCEPCPQHAFCYPSLEASCEQDFVLKPHPLSLGGLIPLPPTCEPDSDKLRRVKVVSDKAVEELRVQRAKYECGEANKDGSKKVTSPRMTAAELKQRVSKSKRKGMSDEEFEELWKGALGEIAGREEVTAKTQGPSSSPIITFSSSSLAKLSLPCAAKRHLRLSLLAYRLPILILVLLASILSYTRAQILAKRSDAARVPSLVSMTLDRLATQAALHARGEALEPWISAGQLRDDVLRDELRRSRREHLWNRVKRIVEGNANVRASVREGRGGDVSRVWEWIGGIRAIGGDLESPSNRLESSRVRFSLLPQESKVASKEIPEGREMKKWDEGRPVY
ncbi:conserved hypothetical protein [Uncinocarpus reesii 1704]|uniref:Sister chromatid separation protein n=1 Tax=Uncinocarpus reesii (strain UAMH 1704) TaxID=336963 RepID=C4JFL8_UNCRE|nr:uncharacterized protein UREG_01032 [Uncinocarpus reesii 1704]EEP76183.1 conserved hypothetical protein [Uncinocarpus reesii 1704]